jgi:hypothetical protein
MPGPPPKRSSQRRRRNKPEGPDVDVVSIRGKSVKAPAEDRAWHPIAKGWYRSLKQSGEAQFYEPSDWQAARFCAHIMTDHLNSGQLRAGMIDTIWSMMGDLLTTEAARRRARIELERAPAGDGEKEASVSIMDEYRELGG